MSPAVPIAHRVLDDPDQRTPIRERNGTRPTDGGQGLAFCKALSRLLWDGSVDGWNQGDHLVGAVDGAGLDLAEMEAAIAADPDRQNGRSPFRVPVASRYGGACGSHRAA